MRIDIIKTFRDGRDSFYEGERNREVDGARALKFIEYGWAAKVGETPQAQAGASGAATLNIHNGHLGQTSEV